MIEHGKVKGLILTVLLIIFKVFGGVGLGRFWVIVPLGEIDGSLVNISLPLKVVIIGFKVNNTFSPSESGLDILQSLLLTAPLLSGGRGFAIGYLQNS